MKELYLPHQAMMCVTGTSKSTESGYLQGWLISSNEKHVIPGFDGFVLATGKKNQSY